MSTNKALDRNRWLAGLLPVAMAALLTLLVVDFGGKLPPLPSLTNTTTNHTEIIPVSRMENLFGLANVAHPNATTNLTHPFYTTHFQPPPPKPQPPPPTTKKVDVLFQGVYQSADGVKEAFLKVVEAQVIGPVGTKVVGDFAIAEITLSSLTVTNTAGKTNILQFNVKQPVEIPAN